MNVDWIIIYFCILFNHYIQKNQNITKFILQTIKNKYIFLIYIYVVKYKQ